MRKEHKTKQYTLYKTEGKNDEHFCKGMVEELWKGGEVSLWVDSDGKVDGIKVWKKQRN